MGPAYSVETGFTVIMIWAWPVETSSWYKLPWPARAPRHRGGSYYYIDTDRSSTEPSLPAPKHSDFVVLWHDRRRISR